MLRAEAEGLIGSRVSVWTAANGTYVGELVEVVPHRPWRGRLRITGVLKVACHWEVGRGVCRRGFRPGEEIEAGGSSIEPTDQEGVTYLEALGHELAWLKAARFRDRDEWMRERSIAALRSVLERERAEAHG